MLHVGHPAAGQLLLDEWAAHVSGAEELAGAFVIEHTGKESWMPVK